MEKMPIAAQVYSVREEAGADFAGTMQTGRRRTCYVLHQRG